MNRRKFIHNTSLAAVGLAIAPQFITAANKTKNNKLILVILSGGIRLQDITNEANMPMLFNKKNGLIKKGVFFNKVQYTGEEITHSKAKYALLNGSSEIDHSFINAPWKSKINSDYIYIDTDLKDKEKLLQSYIYAANVDSANFIVIDIEGADVAHYNFKEYKNHLQKVDVFLAELYNTNIKSKQDFTLIVSSEHGRNNIANAMGGLDHYQPEARNTFAWIASNNLKIKQGKTINTIIDNTEIMPFCKSILDKNTNKQNLNLNLAFA